MPAASTPSELFAPPSQDDTRTGNSKASGSPPASEMPTPTRYYAHGLEPPVDQTLDRPLLTPPPNPPTSASWPDFILPASAPSQDETLSKGSAPSSPPPIEGNGIGTIVSPTEPQPAPEATLARPPAPPTDVAHGGGPAAPAGITGYELLGVLGRGGMGVVYKAKQLGLNRVVALKMILHASHASVEDLVRFQIEAEAVAQLKHPNIVQIHDIGQREGRPFFSLEYLEGGSLQQRLKGEPLAPRTAAVLLETVARAVDFAHRHGIVHRDLKPANILLAEPAPHPLENSTPKIADFGLAKRLESEDQGQTGTEAVLGTPTYMAPEQASNSKTVGPLADVYALGAILYDLLTGRPPFKGTTVLDTLQMVQRAEPVAPSALNNKIPRDLQTICLKCLEKAPSKRYDSAAHLADDLKRFLEGRPIEARPVGTIERAWKWTTRHPMAAALVAVCVAAPLVIAGLSIAFALNLHQKNTELETANDQLGRSKADVERERDQKEKARQQEEEQRKKAELAREQAIAAEKLALSARAAAVRAEEDAQDSFARAQQSIGRLILIAQKKLRNEPGTEKIRRDLLEEAVQMCQHFTSKPGATPASRLRAAQANRLSADLRAQLGETKKAEEEYLAALKLYDELTKDASKADVSSYIDEAVETSLNFWSLLAGTQPERAEKLLQVVLERMDRIPPERVAALAKSRRNRAVLLGHRAIQYQNQGRYAEAEADYQAALEQLGQIPTSSEVPVELVALETARIEVNRSALYLGRGTSRNADAKKDLALAARAGQRAVESLTKLVEKNPQDTQPAIELGRACTNLGQVHVARQDLKAAAALYDDAVAIFERQYRGFSSSVDYKHLLAVALGNQGLQLLRESLPGRAREPIARGRKLLEELAAGFTDIPVYRQDLARLCNSQGVQFLQASDNERALEPLLAARKHLLAALPKHPPLREDLQGVERNLRVCYSRLAFAAAERNDWSNAEPHIKALEALSEKRVKELKQLPRLPATTTPSAKLERAAEVLLARAELAGTLQARARVAELRGDHSTVSRIATRLGDDLLPKHWPGWIEQAARLCRCARLAEEDKKLTASERAGIADGYLRQALGLLAGVAASGNSDLALELRDESFDLLRKRPAYRDNYRRLLTKKAEGN